MNIPPSSLFRAVTLLTDLAADRLLFRAGGPASEFQAERVRPAIVVS